MLPAALEAMEALLGSHPVDPDRVYVTGQSMGGHMSWRCGIAFPDRFAAIGPQSGGYDYVANQQVFRLFKIVQNLMDDDEIGIHGCDIPGAEKVLIHDNHG